METGTVNRQLAWLTAQHERLLGIVDGLTEEQMRTAVLPSGWTPVGMLVHVREATRFWLAEIMLGDHPTEQFTDEALPGDSADEPFRIPDEVPIAEVTARFRTITGCGRRCQPVRRHPAGMVATRSMGWLAPG